MDRNLANRAFKSPPSPQARAATRPLQTHQSTQTHQAHELQRRAVEQSLLRRDVKLKRPA